jgi:hypothetical protein
VLEGQGEVVQRVEPILEQCGYALGIVGLHPWHGVSHHWRSLFLRASSFRMRTTYRGHLGLTLRGM